MNVKILQTKIAVIKIQLSSSIRTNIYEGRLKVKLLQQVSYHDFEPTFIKSFLIGRVFSVKLRVLSAGIIITLETLKIWRKNRIF